MKTVSDALVVIAILKLFGVAPFVAIGIWPIVGLWVANVTFGFIVALLLRLAEELIK